ncbi:pentapeptide repeat-containing protein [Calothrix sp. CCY 0018]|uniref:pentapeptide repeat-containing protein n=1 Tax=Calothrix sp. CCY 0018 TaxID=3103864 RepID=UPI0039C5EA14
MLVNFVAMVANHHQINKSLNFSSQNLQGISFKRQNLTGADFSYTDIRGADFTQASLQNANFNHAKAGVQSNWTIIFIAFSFFLSTLCLFSAWMTGVIVAETVFQSSNPLYDGVPSVENSIPGLIVLVVLAVFCITTIRQGFITALLAMAAIGGATVVVLGTVLGLYFGAAGLKMIGAGAWRAAAAGTWAIIATFTGAIAVFASTFESKPKFIAVFKVIAGLIAIAVAINVFKASDSEVTALKMPALPMAMGVTIILLFISIYTGWRCLLEDQKFASIQQIGRALFTFGGTSFRGADLTNADFSQSSLKCTDLRNAKLICTSFHLAKNLKLARVDGTILTNPNVRDLVVTHRGVNKSYLGCNFKGANLEYADLSDADFTAADISEATFAGAILSRANLTKIQALGTNFQQVYLTAACLENWHINEKTQLENINCDYIYLQNQQQERHPPSGIFADGEFTKLFQVVVDTIELIFRNGVDWEALILAIKEVSTINNTEKLIINSIENKGDGFIVVKVHVPENVDRGKLHQELEQSYQQQLKIVEARYQAELEGKQAQIEIYRQQSADMTEIAKLLAQQSSHRSQIQVNKLIILTLGDGNFNDGFPITALVCSDEHPLPITFTGKLPPEPNILQLYQQWRQLYGSQKWFGRITFDEEDSVTNFSQQELNYYAGELEKCFDSWLNSQPFQLIERQLRSNLRQSEKVPVIIQTKDINLQRLPWHLWKFFQHYRQAEISLSSIGERSEKSMFTRNQIRILTILGNSTGIDVEADRKVLEQLPQSETVFLVEPTFQELHQQLWDEQGWDILCFSGHSSSQADGSTGKMLLNQTKLLTIKELKHALTKAIERGLQLAIFNSCDGLGLARELADLHIPQIIVMKEPVPDKVAQEFLKYFLTAFAGGESLYTAVRKARERLEGLEDEYPYATWLPVIFQNSAEVGMSWQNLHFDK